MPLFTSSVRITVSNHTEVKNEINWTILILKTQWLGNEVEGLLNASSLHSDLLLVAGDGGRYLYFNTVDVHNGQ